MKVLILSAITICWLDCYTQNLILNGDFEKYDQCIDDFGEIGIAKGWFQQVGSADYYNRCNKKMNFVGVPKNFNGYQNSFSGDGYAGLFLFDYDKRYSKNGFYNREYLQTELALPLMAGKRYKFSFYFNLADSAKYYTSHFSACFSTDLLNKLKINESVLTCVNKISVKVEASKAMDKSNWNKLEIEYIASGGEMYVSIGFFNDDITNRTFKRLIRKNRISNLEVEEENSYYYIDNVSLTEIN